MHVGRTLLLHFQPAVLARGKPARKQSGYCTDVRTPLRHESNLFIAVFRAKLYAGYEVLQTPDRDRRRIRVPGPAGLLHLSHVAQWTAASAGEIARN